MYQLGFDLSFTLRESHVLMMVAAALSFSIVFMTSSFIDYVKARTRHQAAMTKSLEQRPSRGPSRQPSVIDLPKSSPSPSQAGDGPPSPDDDHPCAPPARSNTHAAHHTRASVQLDRAIRRTYSFSAHLLSNSAKQSKALRHQIASRGKVVFHPRRAKTLLRLHAEISHSSAKAPSVIAEASDSNVDQSSSEDESKPQSTSSLAPAPVPAPASEFAPAPAPTPAPTRRNTVSRMGAKSRKATPPSPRTSTTINTSSEQSSSEMPSPSTPSTPERSARSRNQSPHPGGPRPTTSKASRRFKSKPAHAEPIRYARPACPENSLPGVVFETRYENPIKSMFGTKRKDDAGSAPSTPDKSAPSLKLSKTTSSVRRLLASAPATRPASEAATDADVSASEGESRRSSIDSTASAATTASKVSNASKFSRLMRRGIARQIGGPAPTVARSCNESGAADAIAPEATAVAAV
ncbi:hypothetical protein GY45DRAFT_1406359 [Cubamyces sp. BRFM 1775]|nr:hypothetical protein GY45DRAFT_1406359 [Cubamyces sp. BRFM 1775]